MGKYLHEHASLKLAEIIERPNSNAVKAVTGEAQLAPSETVGHLQSMKAGREGHTNKGEFMGALKFSTGKPDHKEELYFLKHEKELIENLRRRAHLELVPDSAHPEESPKGPTRIKR